MDTSADFIFENGEGYKNLFDNAHDLIHFAKPDGSLMYVNKSWMNILGYSQEEIQGKSIFSFIDEPGKEHFIKYRNGILAGNSTDQTIITTLKTKAGRLVKIEGFILVEWKNNQLIYTTGIFRDVTKNLENEENIKHSNEQLKQSESDLLQLLIYAPDAIIVIDQYGIVQFWNPKAEAIFGWTSSEITGQSLTNTIIPSQHREAHDRGMQRYLSTGEAQVLNKTIEITALKRQGEEFYVSLTISTTRQKGNVAFIAFIRDITLQKNNEWELEKNRRALEASNRELEQFAHVASHDMKEPIRKIRIFTERTQLEFENILPEIARTYLDKISTASDRLNNMVDGVLKYSSITSMEEPLMQINLNQILESIEDDLEVLIMHKGATINYGIMPPFEGVSFLIYQLFYNLISNSLKFAKEGIAPYIEITARILKENDLSYLPSLNKNLPYVEILVNDNGIGFNAEYAEKIFQAFARLNSRTEYEGTGLGLALCKNIVERFHGYITAKGEEGKGASFKIILPQKQAS